MYKSAKRNPAKVWRLLKAIAKNRAAQSAGVGLASGTAAYGAQEALAQEIAQLADQDVSHGSTFNRFMGPAAIGLSSAASMYTKNPTLTKGTLAAATSLPVVTGTLTGLKSMRGPSAEPPLPKLIDRTTKYLEPEYAGEQIAKKVSDKIPEKTKMDWRDKFRSYTSPDFVRELAKTVAKPTAYSLLGAGVGRLLAEAVPRTTYAPDEVSMSPKEYEKYKIQQKRREKLYNTAKYLLPLLGATAGVIPTYAPIIKDYMSKKSNTTKQARGGFSKALANVFKSEGARQLALGAAGYGVGKTMQTEFQDAIVGEQGLKGPAAEIAPLIQAFNWATLGRKGGYKKLVTPVAVKNKPPKYLYTPTGTKVKIPRKLRADFAPTQSHVIKQTINPYRTAAHLFSPSIVGAGAGTLSSALKETSPMGADEQQFFKEIYGLETSPATITGTMRENYLKWLHTRATTKRIANRIAAISEDPQAAAAQAAKGVQKALKAETGEEVSSRFDIVKDTLKNMATEDLAPRLVAAPAIYAAMMGLTRGKPPKGRVANAEEQLRRERRNHAFRQLLALSAAGTGAYYAPQAWRGIKGLIDRAKQ